MADLTKQPGQGGEAQRPVTEATRLPNPTAAVPAAGNQAQAPHTLECDDSGAPALYCNFARVSGTPEEVILDFGLNPEPMGVPKNPIKVSQKLVMNYYTAKRLLGAISMAIQHHEAAFGALETDVNKRVRGSGR
jgi:Protein of unknown function (DUF3467)